MLRSNSIRGRSVLLLLGLLAACQILNLAVLAAFVIWPQIQRVSELVAQNILAIKSVMGELSPDQQQAFIASLSKNSAIQFHAGGAPPETHSVFPNLIERAFMLSLEQKLRSDPRFSWRRDGAGRIWLSATLAGKPYWITANPPQRLRPELGLLIGISVVLLLAFAAGIVAQNWIAQPLTQLSAAAANVSLTSRPEPLPEGGLSEIGALTESFNRMTARLATAESERELMLAGVSHDLRTPLAKIRLAAEMVGAADTDLKDVITGQVERMDAMLGQFLDFARGVEDEEPQRTDLAALARAVIGAHGEGHFVVNAPHPAFALVRPNALTRALTNLVVNAARYGRPPGAVEVIQDRDTTRIAVIDHGPGIPADQRTRLLQPFARGDAARGGKPGSGLGLSIAARIAGAHGGMLTFEARADGTFAAVMTLRSARET